MTLSQTSPDPEYREKLAQVGAKLQQVRQEKGISLAEITRYTLIPERHLIAIEQGNLEALPELVYVQGFVRKYAKYLGVSELAAELPPAPDCFQNWSNSRTAKLDSLHLYFIYVAVVAGLVSLLAAIFSSNNYRPQQPPQDATTSHPQETKVVSTPNPTPVPNQLLNLRVVMLGESWMRVTVDGEVRFEGILPEGQSVTWSGQRQIKLRVGNGEAVSASFNGSPSVVLGAKGEVVEKVFGKDRQE
jgi:transcriptional regulator with XRE-family HTH domain